jgi:GntR family transcriptional regulator
LADELHGLQTLGKRSQSPQAASAETTTTRRMFLMSPPVVVDHSSAEPLYEQLAAIIRARVSDGETPHGSMLAEKALSEEHKVARETVRRALKQLQGEGIVRALPRRGWLVLS